MLFIGNLYLYSEEPTVKVELSQKYIYIYSSDLSSHLLDSRMKGTIKSGIPKKISYIITLFIRKDNKDYSIDRYEFVQEINYDVWEEEFHVKLDNDISQTFDSEDEAFSALCTLNGIRFSIPEQMRTSDIFFVVVAAKSEPFSSKEKEALQNWVSTDRGKGISFQGLLDFFLEKGIRTTEKRILIKSPLYKSK